MRVPEPLSTAFGAPFEELIGRFATEKGLCSGPADLTNTRFLARSVIPHVRKLSSLFNREEVEQGEGLAPYWKESSNPANLRLAYFIYFMPSNLYRIAAIWAELGRLGFRWNAGGRLKGIEIGAGPATGACGIAAGEAHSPAGLPAAGDWALVEQDKAMLELGAEWAAEYFPFALPGGRADWGTRTFHRRTELKRGLLPPTAPKFNLWLMSFFLNELTEDPAEIARALLDSWERHLEDEGLAILVEPALKLQSRRLLEVRKHLLAEFAKRGHSDFKILLPCLGHQSCGALAAAEDWCHEEVSWWRPPYFRVIDRLAGLDRKTLPFSYLVIARSKRSREALLPVLASAKEADRHRLVSPAHAQGKELEFFLCGQEGKRRARYHPPASDKAEAKSGELLVRGDIIAEPELRGDVHSSRVQTLKKIG